MRLFAFLDPDDVPVVGALEDEDTVKPLGVGLRGLIDDGYLADPARFASEVATIDERQDRSTLRPAAAAPPRQDRLRRPQLPRARRRGRPGRARPAAAVREVREHRHRRR